MKKMKRFTGTDQEKEDFQMKVKLSCHFQYVIFVSKMIRTSLNPALVK